LNVIFLDFVSFLNPAFISSGIVGATMTREISSRAKLEVAEVVLLTDDVMLDPQDVSSVSSLTNFFSAYEIPLPSCEQPPDNSMELVSEILSIQVEYWMARLGSTEALRMRKRLNDAFRHKNIQIKLKSIKALKMKMKSYLDECVNNNEVFSCTYSVEGITCLGRLLSIQRSKELLSED